MGPGAEADQSPPAGDDLREPGPTHWIAKERLGPGKPSWMWVAALSALCLLVLGLLVGLSGLPTHRLASENTYQQSDGFLQGIGALLGVQNARIVSAVAAAVAVAATGILARRLLHAEMPSLLAAALVALDPAYLIHGRLATPVAPANAAALLAVALFLGKRTSNHWWASGALALATFLEPAYLTWTLPLAVLSLVRGHIYAAPQHAFIAGLQAILVPTIGAIIGLAGASSASDGCYQRGPLPSLLQTSSADLGGVMALPNPVTWFGGMVALLALTIWGAATVLGQFRLQRLPGRIQARLGDPLKRIHGRALWLAFFAVTAPTPLLWLPMFATALAAGVHELGRDSRAFGVTVGIVLLAFAAIATSQALDVLTLDTLGGHLPWSKPVQC